MTAIAWSVTDIAPGVQRADFTTDHPEHVAPQHSWLTWCRTHGIDPTQVVARYLERDEPARQIRFDAFVLDEDGHKVIRPDGPFLKVPVVHQLEAAPQPFPTPETR